MLTMVCIGTWLPAAAQGFRNDTIADRTHRLQGVTVTEERRQKTVRSTTPYHLMERGISRDWG